MEKYHKQEVSPVEEEKERDETFEADNPQILICRELRKLFVIICVKKSGTRIV